ncbi:MAG: tripartite tricarboxylate transporter permease [Methylobacteriaceae bacterium]|jgi:putative tricarboxylic transport membrane protein|nr:tripartite tricarboxylate transporter permease [Methylobacteriaceae bacterium]
MDLFSSLLSQASPDFFALVFVGSLLGLVVGAVPGLSVTMATALLISVTFTWSVNNAVALIMGVYVSGVYAGALSAIVINIPGAPSSVATTLDGFPMARQGRAAEALFTATIHSFFGTLFGLFVLMLVIEPLTSIALAFSPLDYFLLACFGLSTVGSLTSKSFIKGMISACLGVLFAFVGMDEYTGEHRFTFDIMELQMGIPLVAVLIGLFGFSEVLSTLAAGQQGSIAAAPGKFKPDFKTILKQLPLSLRSSVIGVIIGALPGTGGTVAALLAYDNAKLTVKNPKVPFGEGAAEGVVASESANNACIGGALIPMLALAVPGDAVTAVILAAFYVHGLRPGPMLLQNSPDTFNVILAGGFVAAGMMLLLGLTVVPQMAKVVMIPKRLLMPMVTVLCVIGAYAVESSIYQVVIMLVFGLLGYFMRLRGYAVAPMVLGIVLGGIMDINFRKAMNLADADEGLLHMLLSQPISLCLLGMTIIAVGINLPWSKWLFSRRGASSGG